MPLQIHESVRSYRSEWLRPDIVAGLTSAAVVLPKAMAYATVAGLPVQVGLYTAFLPMVIYAMLGSSRVLSVSTTTTLAILTGAELSEIVPNSNPATLLAASATLAFLVGVTLIIASILRLGFVANFISEPVLVGFKAGIGAVIVLDQVPKLLGVHFPKGGFVQNLLNTFRNLPNAKAATLIVGITMIVLLVALHRIAPKIPAPLIAVAASVLGAYYLNLSSRGVDLVGFVPKSLPALSLPAPSLIAELWPGALGIALMSFTETIAAGRAFARNDEPSPNPNRELIATGLANVGGALLGAMPGGGGTSQTAVNRLAGAKTQASQVVTAAMALMSMTLLAPLLALMPQATLAAIVVIYSVGLIKPVEFREILRVRRTEFTWAVVAFAGVILLGTLKGIVVAIIVSLIALAYQVADPPVYMLGRKPGTNVFRPRSREHPEDEFFEGLLIVRLAGRVFFANAHVIGQKVKTLVQETHPGIVAIDLSGVPDLEYTALKMLTETENKHRPLGVRLWLVGMNPAVLAMVQNSQLGKALGREGMHFTLEIAVQKYANESKHAASAD